MEMRLRSEGNRTWLGMLVKRDREAFVFVVVLRVHPAYIFLRVNLFNSRMVKRSAQVGQFVGDCSKNIGRGRVGGRLIKGRFFQGIPSEVGGWPPKPPCH